MANRPEARPGQALLTAALWLTLAATAFAADAPQRDRFGASDWPLWSPLDPFQQYALTRVSAAQAGDPDALLALYLLAAGEATSLADFRHHRDELDAWLSDLPLPDDPLQAAERLFYEMHAHYLGSTFDAASTPENYSVDQSQLAALLRSGTFNCISSSMLYIVAARKLDLDVMGVLLPSHAFVQLNLPGGSLDIETTAFNGFGIPHTEAFYASESGNWFASRELAPPTWMDYVTRQVVSPFALGVFNMSNQHTEEDRMPYLDRLRLAEIRGLLAPFDQQAQHQRLAYYYEEYVILREGDDYPSLNRLYTQIGDYLDDLAAWEFADQRADTLYVAVQAQRADTLVRTDAAAEGLALARWLLANRRFGGESEPVEAHLYSAINVYSRRLAEQQRFSEARDAYADLEARCVEHPVCDAGLARLYSLWTQHFVGTGNWARSADLVEEFLLLSPGSNTAGEFRDNLERIYLNWSLREERDGEWETALGLLQRCSQTLHAAPHCDAARERIESQRDAGFL
ncbi:MAG: transglutaminase family protein [Halieaceae bacterium]|jgi:hypothetical protein|nr:transglutaminase family protein [Halieaceae bacterium]